ncbi:MAG: HEPN domain-containing protein [Acidimicrobiia bacterium]
MAIERMLERGQIERVPPSDNLAQSLIDASNAHLVSAATVLDSDPPGAFQLAYDAARKACAALLAVQGLRPTTAGGHRAVQEAMTEQFGSGFSSLGRLRRQRNDTEYPDADSPSTTSDDAAHAIEEAGDIVNAAKALLASGQLTPFR